MESSLKASVDELSKAISKLFSVNASSKALKQMKSFYDIGVEEMELQLDMNFTGNKQNMKNFQKFVVEQIKGFTDGMRTRLRKEVMDSIMNRESLTKLRKRVQDTFDLARTSAERIARTESNRAYNMGHRDAAIESGIKLKKMVVVQMDDRTSPICKRMNKKYGKPEQAININAKFIDDKTGKEFDIPPFHPNCFVPGTKIRTQQGEKNIEDIEIGDYVYTHKNRYKSVYSVMKRKVSEKIYKIKTSKGVIEVTGEHPIMTNTGWKLAKDLTIKDWVLHAK